MRRNRKHLFESLESRHLLAGDLRITEVNYHPHPSMLQFGERDVEADDYEFIELENAGDQPLNLRGYALTNGVEFGFDAMNLDPGRVREETHCVDALHHLGAEHQHDERGQPRLGMICIH